MSKNSRLVTVYTPLDNTDQVIIQTMLQEADIPYFCKSESIQNLFGMGQIGGYNHITGPIEIQVAVEDEARARELISKKAQVDESYEIPDTCPACQSPTEGQNACPDCGLVFVSE